MGKMDEMIIVAPRSAVFEDEALTFQGTLSESDSVNRILEHISNSFEIMRRGDAEENDCFKQPIPYAIIQRENEIFVYERLKGAGETRLHNKLSLGVGGHMNDVPDAEDFEDVLSDNLLRELEEELIIDEDGDIIIEHLGLINDDKDEVGRVHLGVLASIKLFSHQNIEVREKDELAGMWMTLEELKNPQIYDRLENWSKIVVDIL